MACPEYRTRSAEWGKQSFYGIPHYKMIRILISFFSTRNSFYWKILRPPRNHFQFQSSHWRPQRPLHLKLRQRSPLKRTFRKFELYLSYITPIDHTLQRTTEEYYVDSEISIDSAQTSHVERWWRTIRWYMARSDWSIPPFGGLSPMPLYIPLPRELCGQGHS